MYTYLVAVQSEHAPAVQTLYLLRGIALDDQTVEQLSNALLHDPVVQRVDWQTLDELGQDPFVPATTPCVLEVAYRPGVTDNEAESALEGARRLGLTTLDEAHTLRRYLLAAPLGSETAAQSAHDLANDLIQTTLSYGPIDDPALRQRFYATLLAAPSVVSPTVASVPVRDADDAQLMAISKGGVLALDLIEMRVVQDYFVELGRDPTDGELETIAQTWSEHCSHKTFKAKVRYRTTDLSTPFDTAQGSSSGQAGRRTTDDAFVSEDLYPSYYKLQGDCEIDSLIRTFLMVATQQVIEDKQRESAPVRGSSFAVLSAFVDNAGILAFGADHEISFKVETHNHPSALEPFGGANTGIGGVVRDVLGVSGRPIANTDVLCFGPLDRRADTLPEGVLPPQRIAAGVVAGVRDYGNKLGIPTVNGAVLYEPGYLANPLVFCGTLGIAPRDSNPHNVQPGDAVVVLGGRTGRDGIHGATFSSEELTHTTATTVGSAVQIGDPITEKKVLDVLLQARDRQLYSGITDCGAGGLSSAVGEIGAETGVSVDLTTVSLKYPGLQPWEIWLSEAQERMVLAVPQDHLADFLTLCASEDVQATAIGTFTDDRRLRVQYGDLLVVDLGMEFLHDGRPQRVLEAVWQGADTETRRHGDTETELASTLGLSPDLPVSQSPSLPVSVSEILLSLLAHPNIASKESIVRTYDHEVGGGTVVKPLVGVASDGPGDAAVLQPLRHLNEGVALGCGINARYGAIDPYWMALACVDEALRNVVAVGGDPSRTAILDNFCWGDPREPDRMAGLVRATAGCYDAAVALGTPFISGKDSLNNEWRLPSGERQPIPPTLLISALALVPDVNRAVTMDVKEVGNHLYLLGETRAELDGAHVWDVVGTTDPSTSSGQARRPTTDDKQGEARDHASSFILHPSSLPHVDLALAKRLFAGLHGAISAGLVRACHDLSEGGLGVAAAEMAFAGGFGLEMDIAQVALHGEDRAFTILFAESTTRFLVEVRPDAAAAFEATLAGLPVVQIGTVTETPELIVRDGDSDVLQASLAQLKAAWQRTN